MYYHGTSAKSWRVNKISDYFFVTTSREDAATYAYEQAAVDQTNGHKAHPRIVEVPDSLIRRLEKEADNPSNYLEIKTWEDSKKEYGSFVILNLPNSIKKKFKLTKI